MPKAGSPDAVGPELRAWYKGAGRATLERLYWALLTGVVNVGPWPTFFLEVTRKARTVGSIDTQLEAVRAAVEPAVGALGLAVYDVELVGSAGARTLRLTVTRSGGVDLETITSVTRAVSPIVDPIIDECSTNGAINGSYLLEVSSPGIERALRRPEHFRQALGEEVSVKFHTSAGPKRVRGVLRGFDGAQCFVESDEGVDEEIAISDITQARTVFEWGPQPRQGSSTKSSGTPARARAKGKS